MSDTTSDLATEDQSPRQRILEASARLFMRNGFAATTVRQIGEEARVSQSSLYYYIESKAHLLRALHERFLIDMLERLDTIDHEEGTPTEKLRGMVRVVLSIIESHHAEVTVFLREQHSLPVEMRHSIIEQRDRVDGVFDRVIQEGIQNGEFREDLDVRLTRLAVLGACNWAYQWFRAGTHTSQEIGDYFADILLRGLAAQPGDGVYV